MDFNSVAENWNNSMRIERANKIAMEIRKNIEHLDLKSALEFGCGTGLITYNLVDLFKKIDLIDTSEKMVEIVNEKANILKVAYAKGICKNILEEEHSKKYDCIYTSMALHHIVDTKLILKKFYDMLNPSGVVCVVDLDEDIDGSFHANEEGFDGHDGFVQKDFGEVSERCGFKIEKNYTFYKNNKDIGDKNIKYSLFLAFMRKK
ncbi:MAG: class I SAM-dependent DNA methyltransferase [Sarcina sp.]